METQIIDNALSSEEFEKIQKAMMSDQFPWFYNNQIAGKDSLVDTVEDNYYFVHTFYNRYLPTNTFSLVVSLMSLIKPNAIIRVKANLYLRTEKIVHHDKHIDFPFETKGAILYINTNNGLTILEDGTECKSVANRLLLFDASKPHHSTTCTDQKRRININVNFS